MFKKIIYLLIISLNNFGQDLAHDQNFLIPSNAANNDYVGRLLVNANWDTISSVSYLLELDTSGIFAISGSNLIIADNTGLQASVTYRITFSVNDYTSDEAYAYIYVKDVDSCVFINLDGVDSLSIIDNSMDADSIYLLRRGTQDTINYEFNINAATTIGAYERIVDKVLKFPSGRDM